MSLFVILKSCAKNNDFENAKNIKKKLTTEWMKAKAHMAIFKYSSDASEIEKIISHINNIKHDLYHKALAQTEFIKIFPTDEECTKANKYIEETNDDKLRFLKHRLFQYYLNINKLEKAKDVYKTLPLNNAHKLLNKFIELNDLKSADEFSSSSPEKSIKLKMIKIYLKLNDFEKANAFFNKIDTSIKNDFIYPFIEYFTKQKDDKNLNKYFLLLNSTENLAQAKISYYKANAFHI